MNLAPPTSCQVEGLEARDDASKWGYYGKWSLAMARCAQIRVVVSPPVANCE